MHGKSLPRSNKFWQWSNLLHTCPEAWKLDKLTFDLSLTFTKWTNSGIMKLTSKWSSSQFYGPRTRCVWYHMKPNDGLFACCLVSHSIKTGKSLPIWRSQYSITNQEARRPNVTTFLLYVHDVHDVLLRWQMNNLLVEKWTSGKRSITLFTQNYVYFYTVLEIFLWCSHTGKVLANDL